MEKEEEEKEEEKRNINSWNLMNLIYINLI